MDPQMSSYPPPPQPDQKHYDPVYPSASEPQQLLDSVQHDDHAYNIDHLDAPAGYPKIETETLDPSTSSQIEQRIEQLQHQHHLQSEHQPSLPPHLLQDLKDLAEPEQQHQHQHQNHDHDQPHHILDQQAQQLFPPPLQDVTPNKVNRLRKACDSCSIRKVKCDEAGPPCKACAALDIPCTFERPSRRRGPPNRHAENIKRRRLESPQAQGQSDPSSPTHAAQALAALSSHPAPPSSISADSILPVEIIDVLISDYFTHVYPLCPFPHEPSFREAWRRREDYSNKPFLALLASMIGALVASFPRKPKRYLQDHHGDDIFPNHRALVDRCQKVCAAARGPGYLESETLSVHDAATSYLLGIIGTYTFRWRQGRLYLSESMAILRSLGLHKAKDNTHQNLGLAAALGVNGSAEDGSTEEAVDNITLQIGRRVFWTLFVTSKSISAMDGTHAEVFVPPETVADPYPPLPAEVDDFCIFPTHIDPQPSGLLPMMTCFNANVRIALAGQSLSLMDFTRAIDKTYDPEKQMTAWKEALQQCREAMSSLPSQLNTWSSANSLPASEEQSSGHETFALLRANMGLPEHNTDHAETPDVRRNLQYEVQKANVSADYLCTRLETVEKFLERSRARLQLPQTGDSTPTPAVVIEEPLEQSLRRQKPISDAEPAGEEVQEEWKSLVRDLLVFLTGLDIVHIESNGDNFGHKIRFLTDGIRHLPRTITSRWTQESDLQLEEFFNILVKLERLGPTNSEPDNPEDEGARFSAWDEYKDLQSQVRKSLAYWDLHLEEEETEWERVSEQIRQSQRVPSSEPSPYSVDR